MNLTLFRVCVLLAALMFWVTVVAAQSDCPTIVRTALDIAASACEGTGRNQACYGNITLDAVPQAGVSNFTFSQTGDVVNVADVQSLTLTSLDAATEQWGVALLKIQANLPDTLPGQNVTLLLFGDVQIQNAPTPSANTSTSAPTPSATQVLFELTAWDNVDVRSEPSRSAAVVGTLPPRQAVQADGKDESGTWLHIHLTDGSAGWVSADVVSLLGDPGLLPIFGGAGTSASESPPPPEIPQTLSFGPMQAFLFRSAADDRPCAEAPDSGILIQSPQGAAAINLMLNGVNITLGSTAYVQAQPGGDMIMYVVEGHATVSAFNRTVAVPAGTQVRIPIGADLRATAAPGDPEAYDPRKLVALPFRNLPDVIATASPLPDDDIRALNTPPAGLWLLTYDNQKIDVGCAADTYNGGFTTELSYDPNGAILWYGNTLLPLGFGYYESEPLPGATTPHIYKMTVISPTQIEGQNIWIVPGCATIINNFHLVLDMAIG